MVTDSQIIETFISAPDRSCLAVSLNYHVIFWSVNHDGLQLLQHSPRAKMKRRCGKDSVVAVRWGELIFYPSLSRGHASLLMALTEASHAYQMEDSDFNELCDNLKTISYAIDSWIKGVLYRYEQLQVKDSIKIVNVIFKEYNIPIGYFGDGDGDAERSQSLIEVINDLYGQKYTDAFFEVEDFDIMSLVNHPIAIPHAWDKSKYRCILASEGDSALLKVIGRFSLHVVLPNAKV